MAEYIEREAAIETIRSLYPSVPLVKLNIDKWHEKNKAYMECETAIEKLPAADVRPVVRGKWKVYNNTYLCSACGRPVSFWQSNFCPNCGARMDKDGDGDV